MDHLKSGRVTKTDFQDNISDEELEMFNQWLSRNPYDDVIVVSLWNPGGSKTSRYEKYLVGEVIPYIDAHYRTVPDRRFRGIDGACAGAAQAIMITSRHPSVFAYAGGQQTDLGSYPGTNNVFARNIERIRRAGGAAFNINTNVKDGCNSYSNRGRLYHLVQTMKRAGFPVDVHVFKSCPHGYCAYRYPNGHQALYWFSQHFKRNFKALGMNRHVADERVAARSGGQAGHKPKAKKQVGPLKGLW
jgi:hypothetical protein